MEADSLTPTVIWCICLINCATEKEISFYGPNRYEEFRQWLVEHPSALFVGHNILSYDVPNLNRLCETDIIVSHVVDTLVLSYLYHPNMPRPLGLKGFAGPHSLEAWGFRFKFPKGDFHDFEKFSEEMLLYCIQDCRLTLRVFRALTERMRQRGFSERSCWVEHRIRTLIDEQQRTGFAFDAEGAKKLRDVLRGSEQELTIAIQRLFQRRLKEQGIYQYRLRRDGQPYSSYFKHLEKYPEVKLNAQKTEYTVYDWEEFNIGSPKQRVQRLLEFGWQPTKFTKPSATHPKGQPQADEDSIVRFAEECGEAGVGAIADWLVCNGRANMLDTWLNNYNEDTKAIHGRVFSCGAGTRRMTHNTPNTANIVSNDQKYGKECRSLWRARPGRVLVGVDAKAAQMRIFAHYLDNPKATELYVNGDPHVYNAEQIGQGVDKPAAKKAYYSFILGAGSLRLGLDAGRDEAFGSHIKKTLKKVTPGLVPLMRSMEEEWEENDGWLECLDGGWVRCPSKHMCLCYKIQPGEACVMKLAKTIFNDVKIERGLDCLYVGDIHDEWQFDCDPRGAEEVGKEASDAIRKAGEALNLRVPMGGSYNLGDSWAETH